MYSDFSHLIRSTDGSVEDGVELFAIVHAQANLARQPYAITCVDSSVHPSQPCDGAQVFRSMALRDIAEVSYDRLDASRTRRLWLFIQPRNYNRCGGFDSDEVRITVTRVNADKPFARFRVVSVAVERNRTC